MKAYLLVSGLAFALVLVAHALRVVVEGASLAREPAFLGTSLVAAAMALWAAAILLRLARGG